MHPGFDLRFEELPGGSRVMGHGERFLDDGYFDAIEICCMPFVSAFDRGHPIVGIPVFPRRTFTHSGWYVREGAGIQSPRDLVGRRVGAHSYQTAYSVLARADLEKFHGVNWRAMTWVIPEDAAVPIAAALPPPGLRIEYVKDLGRVVAALEAGNIDALFVPFPRALRMEGRPGIRALFPAQQEEEARYFKALGFVPIIHAVAPKRRLVDAHPSLPGAIFDVFVEAQTIARQRWEDPAWSMLLGGGRVLSGQGQTCGEDVWKHGRAHNRAALDHLLSATADHGITRRLLTVDELFLPIDAG